MRWNVIPMAGEGQRFRQAGYTTPKPFLDVAGKPMLARVIENLPPAERWLFGVRQEHEARARQIIRALVGDAAQVRTFAETPPGPAATLLELLRWVPPGDSVLSADCDQYIAWTSRPGYALTLRDTLVAGITVAFRSENPALSYIEWCGNHVTRVEEKQRISERALAGLYFFRSAGLCEMALRAMMAHTAGIHGEYYIAPAYNELLHAGLDVLFYDVDAVWNLGTPETLAFSVQNGPWAPPRDCGQVPGPYDVGSMSVPADYNALAPVAGEPWREV